MKTKDIKTIDIQAKEWFDSRNGNSYFSAQVTVNFGLDNEKTLKLPFQYGYGDHYVGMAKDELIKEGLIPSGSSVLWRYCQENNIALHTTKKEKCLQRDVKAFGA